MCTIIIVFSSFPCVYLFRNSESLLQMLWVLLTSQGSCRVQCGSKTLTSQWSRRPNPLSKPSSLILHSLDTCNPFLKIEMLLVGELLCGPRIASLPYTSTRYQQTITKSWLSICAHDTKNFILGAAYRPGSCSGYDTRLITYLDSAIGHVARGYSAHLLLAGDFNAPTLTGSVVRRQLQQGRARVWKNSACFTIWINWFTSPPEVITNWTLF